jgi:hypothetical protein
MLTFVLFTGGIQFESADIAYGQTVENQTLTTVNVNSASFSIDIPDNWVYEEKFYGVELAPNEFGVLLVNDKPWLEQMNETGAVASLEQDTGFSIKNAGLDLYVKYKIDKQSGINVTSRQNTTIDGEPAVKIYADGIAQNSSCSGICITFGKTQNYTGIKFVEYMTWHNKQPYYFGYMANVKDFEKYLPQFEQIVKTFKFIDKK